MEEISTIKKNIFYFIDYKGITKEEFYSKTGISSSNFKGTNRKSEIGGDKLIKILTIYPEINAEWLITGQGEMLKSNTMGDIRAGRDVIGSGIVSNSTIKVSKGLTTEEQVQQENLKLHYEIKMKDRELDLLNREINLLERDVESYRDALEQLKSSQDMIKELYERKIEDLKRTIRILEIQMESNNKNQM